MQAFQICRRNHRNISVTLLEMLRDQKQTSSVSDVCFIGWLKFKKKECQRRESEVKEIFLSFLQELVFNSIEGVGRYF